MQNPFEQIAEQQIAGPRKTRQRATKKRAKADEERGAQLRVWRHWRRQRLETRLAGAHGANIRTMLEFLENIKLNSASELITMIRSGPWS